MKTLRFEIRIRSAFAALAAVAALFAAASCEKEIEFKGDETTPRLVLYSLSTPGQKLSADVSSSVFFLKQNYDNKLFTSTLDTLKGGLKVYVNGSATPYVMRYTPLEDDYYSSFWQAPTLHYETDYIPSEGDHIRIVAEFPGFETAEGETTVPVAGGFSIVSSRKNLSEDNRVSFDITARVTDRGAEPEYYCVAPARWCSFDGGETYELDYTYAISSQDPLFMGTTSDLMSILGEEGTSSYFSDVLFSGGSYEFKFSFEPGEETVPGYGYYYNEDYPGEDPAPDVRYRYDVSLVTLTESLYNHVLSMRSVSASTYGFFGESATLFSNVKGGYGCVCSSVSLSLPLDN